MSGSPATLWGADQAWTPRPVLSPRRWTKSPARPRPGARSEPPTIRRAPWLHLRRDRPLPQGLITGCFDNISLVTPATGCPGHVKHEALNKDMGTIDPAIGAGTTPRGRTGDNFKRAVEAAIDDTRDK